MVQEPLEPQTIKSYYSTKTKLKILRISNILRQQHLWKFAFKRNFFKGFWCLATVETEKSLKVYCSLKPFIKIIVWKGQNETTTYKMWSHWKKTTKNHIGTESPQSNNFSRNRFFTFFDKLDFQGASVENKYILSWLDLVLCLAVFIFYSQVIWTW